MKATTNHVHRSAERPRSLVTHLIRLSGADPTDARLFANSSGRAAIKRLNISPAIKARTKSTITGRHLIIATEGVEKHVHRRKGVPVHRWTLAQAFDIIADMKPRKAEYKVIQAAALAAAVRAELAAAPLRRLPRHRRWSKRR